MHFLALPFYFLLCFYWQKSSLYFHAAEHGDTPRRTKRHDDTLCAAADVPMGQILSLYQLALKINGGITISQT